MCAARYRANRSLVSRKEPRFRALGGLLLLALVAAAAALAFSRDGDKSPRRAAGDTPAAVQPTAPSPYEVPPTAVPVHSSAELIRALQNPQPTAIALADGIYDSPTPFLNPHGHRLYAANVGGAVLRAGLSLGANDGPAGGAVQGVVFDVQDEERTVEGAEIVVWGTARGAEVLDVTLRGNHVVQAGLVVRQPEGFRGARLVARDFTDYGVTVDANDPALTRLVEPFYLTDVSVAGVGRAVPGSSNGTGEACVWIGNPGVVRRVHVRSCAWTGLWTGTAVTEALFDRIDVDKSRTGVYIEHFTRRSTFEHLRVGVNVRVGILAEWAAPEWGGRPASVENVIQDSWIGASVAGVYLDEGTTRTTVRRSTFVNQRWAAIGNYRGIDNAIYGNDYDALGHGADEVTEEHLSSYREGVE
jgi:hypothetical protein